jgi:hypothetical protein
MRVAGQLLALPAALATAVPVGWLGDATLVLMQRPGPCDAGIGKGAAASSAGDIYTVRGTTVTKIATGATDATVRVVHPTPPPLPTNIPSAAPI